MGQEMKGLQVWGSKNGGETQIRLAELLKMVWGGFTPVECSLYLESRSKEEKISASKPQPLTL